MIDSKLLKPLDYLRIKHPQKQKYDFVLPIIFSLITTCIYIVLPVSPSIGGANGLIALVNNLFQILVGFYIASLAAIATFNKKGMDDKMPGDPPTLKTVLMGKETTLELTRRRFLCLLFGYLSMLSICMYFIGGVANLIQPSFGHIGKYYLYVTKIIFLFIYLCMLYNLVLTTLFGLYYMVDRIHRQDPKIIGKSESN